MPISAPSTPSEMVLRISSRPSSFAIFASGNLVPRHVVAAHLVGDHLGRVVEHDEAAGPHLVDVRLDGFQIERDEPVDRVRHPVIFALARADHVVGVAAADARREVFIRVDFQAHALEDTGDQVARRQAAVAGLPSEHHFDAVEDHVPKVPNRDAPALSHVEPGMRPAVSRLLVAACAAVLAASGAAAAAPAVPPLPAPCGARVAARFTDASTDGNVHRTTVVLSSTGSVACMLSGFPALVAPSAPGAPLAVGHLTPPREVVLAPGSTAAFGLRYITSQAPVNVPCSLGVVVNGFSAAADGTIPLPACASITQIDVTAYARGTQPPPVASASAPPGDVAPCTVRDLALREVRALPGGQPAPDAIYALQNRATAPCRIAGTINIRLLDANGGAFALRFGIRTMIAILLTLPPGYEASFTVAYAPHPPQRCPASTSIAVFVPGQSEPLTAQSTLMACTGPDVRIGNLRAGIPLPPGSLPG